MCLWEYIYWDLDLEEKGVLEDRLRETKANNKGDRRQFKQKAQAGCDRRNSQWAMKMEWLQKVGMVWAAGRTQLQDH